MGENRSEQHLRYLVSSYKGAPTALKPNAARAVIDAARDLGEVDLELYGVDGKEGVGELYAWSERYDTKTLPLPDPEVLERGLKIAGPFSFGGDSRMAFELEDWVVALRERSGQRVDWRFIGGVAFVQAIGDKRKIGRARRSLKKEGRQPDFII